jgi:hypothetical protein
MITYRFGSILFLTTIGHMVENPFQFYYVSVLRNFLSDAECDGPIPNYSTYVV